MLQEVADIMASAGAVEKAPVVDSIRCRWLVDIKVVAGEADLLDIRTLECFDHRIMDFGSRVRLENVVLGRSNTACPNLFLDM